MKQGVIALFLTGILIPAAFPAEFNFDIDISICTFSTLYCPGPVPEAYQGWEDHYQPPSPDMRLEPFQFTADLLLGVGFDASLRFDSIAIGLSIGYRINPFQFFTILCGRSLSWWNTVNVRALAAARVTPAFGLLFRFFPPPPTGSMSDSMDAVWEVHLLMQGCSLFDILYEGVDVPGGVNYSKAFHYDFLEFGWAYIVQASVLIEGLKEGPRFGIYHEGLLFHSTCAFGLGVFLDIHLNVVGAYE